jgi:hypothetical protein
MNHHLVAVGSDLLPVPSIISGVKSEEVGAVVGNASIVDLDVVAFVPASGFQINPDQIEVDTLASVGLDTDELVCFWAVHIGPVGAVDLPLGFLCRLSPVVREARTIAVDILASETGVDWVVTDRAGVVLDALVNSGNVVITQIAEASAIVAHRVRALGHAFHSGSTRVPDSTC